MCTSYHSYAGVSRVSVRFIQFKKKLARVPGYCGLLWHFHWSRSVLLKHQINLTSLFAAALLPRSGAPL